MSETTAKTAAWNGLPPAPKLAGYHWLTRHGDTAPQPAAWSPELGGWVLLGVEGWLSAAFVARRFTYARENPKPERQP